MRISYALILQLVLKNIFTFSAIRYYTNKTVTFNIGFIFASSLHSTHFGLYALLTVMHSVFLQLITFSTYFPLLPCL